MKDKKRDTDNPDIFFVKKDSDEETFTSLFYDYKDKIYGFFLGLTRSPAKAEDMVQEIFMKIWQKRDKLIQIRNINAYIYHIAQNYAIDQLRKKSNDILFSLDDYKGKEDTDTSTQTPLESLINKELSNAIAYAIGKLPSQQRKVFNFHCIDGLSHAEIADKMNISVSTVQNHMRQALINIRMYVSDNYPILLLCMYLSIF
ncbi:RNA polymerase sigma factor [Dysgonomonas reticulitermitis]